MQEVVSSTLIRSTPIGPRVTTPGGFLVRTHPHAIMIGRPVIGPGAGLWDGA